MNRLRDYVRHMQEAADEACGFLDGFSQPEFLADRKTQQAVIMSIVIIGEAATKVMEKYEAFAQRHPEIPWRGMRGMRNQLAHGYFDIDLETVWQTATVHLPALLSALMAVAGEADAEP